jgi:hypothetical protein
MLKKQTRAAKKKYKAIACPEKQYHTITFSLQAALSTCINNES